MKTNKSAILIAAFLGLALLASVACNRDEVSQPANPIGPSSIGVMMNVQASPNVITAALYQRQMSTITATLKKYDGAGQSGRTVVFEIVDAAFNRLDIGYFEGSNSVITRTTDSSGTVRVNYFGPLSAEIANEGSVYIRASAAWEGSQFINDTAQVYLVHESNELNLTAKAIPEVLYAGSSGGVSVIQAVVLAGGQPVKNFPVYFLVNMNLGKFADGKLSTVANTNDQGVATMTYIGPTADEMSTRARPSRSSSRSRSRWALRSTS